MEKPRFDHVGVIVSDMDASIEFFETLGLKRSAPMEVEGEVVDRITGLAGVHSQIVMLETPDGNAKIELAKFISPQGEPGDQKAPSNMLGLRHFTFEVEDVNKLVEEFVGLGYGLVGEVEDYGTSYRLCYVRGPEGIIVEIAERLG